MMKVANKLFILFFMSTSAMQGHVMEPLYDAELQAIDGQAGADLSLYLSLNHTQTLTTNNGNLDHYNPGVMPVFDSSVCSADRLEYCRLALIFNNRSVDSAGNATGTNTGHKQWITLKGVQGTINIQKLGIDGDAISYTPRGGSSAKERPAVKLSFDPNFPILIRNLGFQSLAIENDRTPEVLNSSGVSTNPEQMGYLNKDTYSPNDGAFDANNPTFSGIAAIGREKGFLGVNMNANLQMTGSIRMFSCAASGDVAHPRC